MKVIICEYFPWDTLFRIGGHHYARMFLDNGWDVLWISHPVSFIHAMKAENRMRMELAGGDPVRHPSGPIELVPFTYLPFLNAPILSSRWVLENSLRYCAPKLEKSLQRIGFYKPDLVWITDTAMHSVADIAQPKAIAVRIADDNSEFRHTPRALRSIEEKLMARGDVVFVTSSPLEERLRPKFGQKIHLLRNGVDFDHFQGEYERPGEYDEIEGPIAIYVGAIEEWFAPDWIERLSREREDITTVLIGRAGIDLSSLQSLPNVRLLGPRPYEEIPAYLAHADVGIIPFKRTRLVDSVSPLKLFEFFAAGLPVVSTRWFELERLDSPALLASNAEQFSQTVSRVIDERWKIERGENHRRFARENSWDTRYQSAMKALERFLES